MAVIPDDRADEGLRGEVRQTLALVGAITVLLVAAVVIGLAV